MPESPQIIADGQRVLIAMIDGLGTDYVDASPMPNLSRMCKEGCYREGKGVFPSLTNANNISIACGAWPAEHGVTTNCYFDETAGEPRFLEDSSFLCTSTLFERARAKGIDSALLTCKAKTTKILGQHATIALAAEDPSQEIVDRYGPPPPMYSSEINAWLWDIGLEILRWHKSIRLLYIHTTDYAMHMWPPEDERSRRHLAALDDRLGEAAAIAPDAAILLTADHGMNPKTRCWDLVKACRERGVELRFAVSPVADRLLKHHRGFGGVSYVHLNSSEDATRATEALLSLDGVEEVLPRSEAARRFRLMESRIGDLVVIPDRDTVFGDLPEPMETLNHGYRSHGSLYETDIPLLVYNNDAPLPDADELQVNLDLTRQLYR